MPKKPGQRSLTTSQPTEEIDAEILGSIAALDDGEGGDNDQDDPSLAPPAAIPASQAKRVGALNAAAVQNNRRRKRVLERKQEGEKNVPWGEHDACLLYDDIISLYPPSSVLVHITRVTGSRTSWYLEAQPRNGMELHEAIKTTIHGSSPECEYQVVFRDRLGRQERGRGSIIMPSTEFDVPEPPKAPPVAAAPAAPPPPQALPPQYPQQGQYPQQPPPQYPQPFQPQYQQQHGPPYEPPPMRTRWADEPPPPRAPAQQPVIQQNADPVVVMQLQKQLSDIQGALEGLGRQAGNPMAQQLADIQFQLDRLNNKPTPNAPPPAVVMHVPPTPAAPPPPPPPPVVPVTMPEVPPGYALTMISGMPCFVPLRDLAQGLGAPPAAPAPAVAPVAAAAPAAPPPPPPPPQTMAEQFASTLGSVRSAIAMATQMRDILPEPQAPLPAPSFTPPPVIAPPVPDESPTKVVKIGDVITVQNVEDGSIRPLDTAIANGPAILSWLDRQRVDYMARQDAIARGLPPPPPQQAPPQQPQQSSQIGVPIIPGR